MPRKSDIDQYPSLAWVVVPLLLIPLGFFVRARLAARKLARTGIGRGAPGFQTNVRRIAVTPEIAARLRRGEQVSPEEIAAAQAEAEARMTAGETPSQAREEKVREKTPGPENDTENEWLPDELKGGANKSGAKSRKSKKRR